MIEQDTIRLLRECDAGVQMGISSIDDVLPYVQHPAFKEALNANRKQHERLDKEIRSALDRFHDAGKAPGLMARGMSFMKTKAEMTLEPSDQTIADLMVDGCNMGVKSLSKYLNEYKAADESSKDIAKRLIALEESLSKGARTYL